MTIKNLGCVTVTQDFPAGTVEGNFSASVVGTLTADGSSFSQSFVGTAASSTISADLPDGTYSYAISKNGISSQPSDPFTVVSGTGGGTVSFIVPDASQKAQAPT